MKVVIIGSGTASLLCANYLKKNVRALDITIISKDNNIVGVGGATLMDFGPFMETCGFVESDWYRLTDATYKNGILFSGWREDQSDIWHSFSEYPYGHPHDDKEAYGKNLVENGVPISIVNDSLTTSKISLLNKSTYLTNRGYHIDVHRMNRFLLDNAIHKGCVFKETLVSEYNVGESGDVESVVTTDGETIEADMFIDGSGFNSVFSEFMDRDFRNVSEYLICNAACTTYVSYTDDVENEMHPYTNCVAVDIGWIWNIPVGSRIGVGLVYDSTITTKEEAESFMENHFSKDRITAEYNHINYVPGFNKKSWRNNVVSIGLAAGFIEPLESSGISFFISSIKLLGGALAKESFTKNDINCFNSFMLKIYEDTLDFVNGHYNENTAFRNTPFWDKIRNKKTTETLQVSIDSFDKNSTTFRGDNYNDIFGKHSWLMLFMGFYKFDRKYPLRAYFETTVPEQLGYSNYDIWMNESLRNQHKEEVG